MERNFLVLGYKWIIKVASWLQHPFLLIIRLYWGQEFIIVRGGEKFGSIPGRHEILHLTANPLPRAECLSRRKRGIFWRDLPAARAGLAHHDAAADLFTMISCLSATDGSDLFKQLFSTIITQPKDGKNHLEQIFDSTDKILNYTAFLFLYVAVIVFLFGPGMFSVDGLLKYLASKRNPAVVQE